MSMSFMVLVFFVFNLWWINYIEQFQNKKMGENNHLKKWKINFIL